MMEIMLKFVVKRGACRRFHFGVRWLEGLKFKPMSSLQSWIPWKPSHATPTTSLHLLFYTCPSPFSHFEVHSTFKYIYFPTLNFFFSITACRRLKLRHLKIEIISIPLNYTYFIILVFELNKIILQFIVVN